VNDTILQILICALPIYFTCGMVKFAARKHLGKVKFPLTLRTIFKFVMISALIATFVSIPFIPKNGDNIYWIALLIAVVSTVLFLWSDIQYENAIFSSSQNTPPGKARDSKDYMDSVYGFRIWSLDMNLGLLRSPHRNTVWEGPDMVCEDWEESEVVRGVSGVHAYLCPTDWKIQAKNRPGSIYDNSIMIAGVVERYGRYVLGEDGWRSEWAIIRKLYAPNKVIAEALRKSYPEVEILEK
jgi:branched-subunit amino acid transport protein